MLAVSFPLQSALRADDDEAANRPFLSPLFSENAVVQRDRVAPIWGWTTPGGNVTVALGSANFSTQADASGKWMLKLPAQPAGGPHVLTVTGTRPDERVTLNNLLFGDVWICSGQSNMEWTVALARDGKAEIAAADFPQIRLLAIPNVPAITPQETFQGKWQVCTPKTVAEFSAVGYFFGRKLHQETGVPIGLIDSSFGGTNAEAWLSAAALGTMPDFQERVEAIQAQAAGTDRYDERMAAWWTENDPGTQAKWNLPATSDAAWKTWKLPRLFDYPDGPYPQFDGIVWFRREVDVPASWAGKDLKLGLGTVDDRGTIFWNGEMIGVTNVHNVARVHTVPGRLVKAGRNLIALRVVDGGGGGGLGGLESDMKLTSVGEPPISLAGAWRCLASAPMEKLPKPPLQFRGYHTTVTGLYNGMIAPLAPAAIKGAIWYQGENNNGRGAQYQVLLPKLIADWRKSFSADDFPFYITQLANFEAHDEAPRYTGWTQIQEAQRLVSERVSKSGLAVINDIGAAGDIHPTNKQDVGLRLALLALAKDYGKQVEYSGPTLKSHAIEGSAVVLRFDHAEGGLSLRGDADRVFAIAGEDGKFVWAKPVVQGDTITVSSSEIAKPVAVRFAWSNNPRATLYNGAGLPAALFRTDSYEK
ncbi:MAG: 9-O-acetylesterase [Planctomycetia bacterium]|nr:9-O-acetylesterase [Planctomycetia bacterium]